MNTNFSSKEIDQILQGIRTCVEVLGRDGVVVPTSGGIDSATVLKLSELAMGKEHIRALFLPDGSSSPESKRFAEDAAKAAGTDLLEKNLSDAVAALTDGDALTVVQKYFSGFDPAKEGYSLEINLTASIRLGTPIYELAKGEIHGDSTERKMIAPEDLRTLIANTNVKQRLRMICAYRLAESLHYAVGGSSNKDEAEFGFSVKYGDAASDFYPIIGLEKGRVFALAAAIGVPQSIIDRIPTTDTYSLKQTQQKFFFGLSANLMRIASSEVSTDDQILEACRQEGITSASAANVRSLVHLLSASAAYNDTRLFLESSDWSMSYFA